MKLQLFLSVGAVALVGSFFTDIRDAPASGTTQGSSVDARPARSLSSSASGGGGKWARERRSQGGRAAAAVSPSFVAAASASAAGRPVKTIQAMP